MPDLTRGRVLIVDDEPTIVRNLVRLLDGKRYLATGASDGPAAIAQVLASSEPFDLLVTDIRMPEMDGQQLAVRVHEYSPLTKILFISAFAPPLAGTGVPADAEFLPKPFTLESFLEMVQALIGSRTPPESFAPLRLVDG